MGIVGFMPTSTTVKTGRYRVEQSEFYQRSEPLGAKAVSHIVHEDVQQAVVR